MVKALRCRLVKAFLRQYRVQKQKTFPLDIQNGMHFENNLAIHGVLPPYHDSSFKLIGERVFELESRKSRWEDGQVAVDCRTDQFNKQFIYIQPAQIPLHVL